MPPYRGRKDWAATTKYAAVLLGGILLGMILGEYNEGMLMVGSGSAGAGIGIGEGLSSHSQGPLSREACGVLNDVRFEEHAVRAMCHQAGSWPSTHISGTTGGGGGGGASSLFKPRRPGQSKLPPGRVLDPTAKAQPPVGAVSIPVSAAAQPAATGGNVDHLKLLMDSLSRHPVLRQQWDTFTHPQLPNKRPSVSERKFSSPVVDEVVRAISSRLKDPELAVLFSNCFPNTLDTTVRHFDEAKPDVFVITGDIDAEWLRDSTNQVLPYVPFANNDAKLKKLLCGLIRRQSADILIDPYANAFNYQNLMIHGQSWQTDRRTPPMNPHLHEGKYELDSITAMLKLSYRFYNYTAKDISCFDYAWVHSVKTVLDTMAVQQRGTDEEDAAHDVKYSFQRLSNHNELHHGGRGAPAKRCGLSKCGFRPSDDPCELPFLVPANAMAVVELKHTAEILRDMQNRRVSLWPPPVQRSFEGPLYGGADVLKPLDLAQLINQAERLAGEIDAAIWAHAAVKDRAGKVTHMAYEIDGMGRKNEMDDANLPSLLSLPYLGYIQSSNETYKSIRNFVLSKRNRWYFEGSAAKGVGGPHIGQNMIWPMALIMRGLTSTDDNEIKEQLELIKKSSAGTGLLHESFHVNNPAQFTRKWFAWVNTLFGELILCLIRERPHLLF